MEIEVVDRLFTHGGEMGTWMRSHDWSHTPLGSVSTWSSRLSTTLQIALTACCPMILVWGRDRVLLCNDAYAAIVSEHGHSAVPGERADVHLRACWHHVLLDVEQVFATEQPTQRQHECLVHGSNRDRTHSYAWSYSPIGDPTAPIEGVLAMAYRTGHAERLPASNDDQFHYLAETLPRREAARDIGQKPVGEDRGLVSGNGDRNHADWLSQCAAHEFRAVVENTPDIVVRYDRQLRHLYVNPSIERVLGIPPADFIGRTAIEMGLTNATAQDWGARLQQVFDTGQEQIFEFESPNSAGETRFYQAHFVPEAIWDGTVQTVLAIARDVTPYKQAEAALRQSEERYRSALQAAHMMTWTWDARTDTIMRSDTACEVLGLAPEALQWTGSQEWQPIHPDDLVQHQTTVQTAIRARGSYVSEFRMTRPDNGALIWIEERGKVNVDADGQLIGIEGTLFDISDRKRIETALREREQRLDLATSAARLGVFEWTANTDSAVWENQRIYDIFGHTLADGTLSKAEFMAHVIHPDDRAAFERDFSDGARPGNSFHAICRIQRRNDGEWRWIELSGRFTLATDGTPQRLVGVVGDITHRKRVEAEREHLFICEQAAREAAETANRIKDEFLAVLSHELRSPLNPILGWSKLLQTRTLDAQTTRQALGIIERNARLQTQLIEDLLDVSRILRGKLVLNQVTVNLVHTIAAALETVRLAADAKQIELRWTINDSPLADWKFFLEENGSVSPADDYPPAIAHSRFPVRGDAARLQQIIWNLLSNAVKFTPIGGKVDVQLTQVEDEGWEWSGGAGPNPSRSPASTQTYAQITVSDTGKGIDPAFLPHVFEYFRQEDGATTRRFGGLGLGLAIVHHLAELHGGTVAVESPGEALGATFTVKLPLLTTSSKRPLGEASIAQLPSPVAPLAGIQVLVVDDDPDSREMAAFILTRAGATVTAADSATAALDRIKQSLPDVLICDIGMPAIDGLMLMRQLRTLPPAQGGQIPAIALTAYAGETDRQQALAAGFQWHLAKPFEPDNLVQVLARLMNGREGGIR